MASIRKEIHIGRPRGGWEASATSAPSTSGVARLRHRHDRRARATGRDLRQRRRRRGSCSSPSTTTAAGWPTRWSTAAGVDPPPCHVRGVDPPRRRGLPAASGQRRPARRGGPGPRGHGGPGRRRRSAHTLAAVRQDRGRAADHRRVLEDDVPERQGAPALPRRRAARAGERRPGDRATGATRPARWRRPRRSAASATSTCRSTTVRAVLDAPDDGRAQRGDPRAPRAHAGAARADPDDGGLAAGAAGAERRPAPAVEIGALPPRRRWRSASDVGFDDAGDWLESALAELHAAARRRGPRAAGRRRRAVPRRVLRGGRGRGRRLRADRRRAAGRGGPRARPARPPSPCWCTTARSPTSTRPTARSARWSPSGASADPGPIREHYLTDDQHRGVLAGDGVRRAHNRHQGDGRRACMMSCVSIAAAWAA